MDRRHRRQRRHQRRLLLPVLLLLGMIAAVGVVGAQTSQGNGGPETSVFVPVTPQRVLDTRSGIGGVSGPLGAHLLEVAGVGQVDVNATAVVLNVTVTSPTHESYLTVQPAGEPQRLVSSLNYGPGQTVANSVTAQVGSAGRIWINNAVGTAHVVADLVGYYLPGHGDVGPQGPQGEPGPAGAGVGASGYVYQLATIVDSTVVGGADVPFSNSGPLSGVTHTAGTTTVTVPTEGTYLVDYNVSYTAGNGAQLALAVNGTVDASTPISLLTATGEVHGTAMLVLNAGDVLTLRNNSLVAMTTALSGAVGAQLRLVGMSTPV